MKITSVSKGSRRYGFTLVELVVVVLIMGIIAAVALPKMTSRTQDAKDSAAKQSLAVIRDAIELYKNDNGGYPAAATLTDNLKTYLKGPFPPGPNGSAAILTAASSGQVVTTNGEGWAYYATDGEFYINDSVKKAW